MARWRWRGGNGKVETGEQGEAAKLEDAGGRERLLGWRRLEGRARLLGWRRLVQGEAAPALPRLVTELNMNSERLGKLLMKRFDRKFLRLLQKFRVEHELRKDRKTFDEKI